MRKVAFLTALLLIACTRAADAIGPGITVPVIVQSTNNQAAAATSVTCTLPSTPVNGNLVIAQLASTSPTTSWTLLAGFTSEATTTAPVAYSVQAKVASSEPTPAAYTFANTTSATLTCQMLEITNVNTSTLAAAFDGTVSLSNITVATTAWNGLLGRANNFPGDLMLLLFENQTSGTTYSGVTNNQLSGASANCTLQNQFNTTAPDVAEYQCPVFPGTGHTNNSSVTASNSSTGNVFGVLIAAGNSGGGIGAINEIPVTGAGSTIPGSATVSGGATFLAHEPIYKLQGCPGSHASIQDYNLDVAFAGGTKQNVNIIEGNAGTNADPSAWHDESTNCVAAQTAASVCPVAQVPLPGEEPCVPAVYFTATHAGTSDCNNHAYYTAHNTNDADFYHFQAPLTNVNLAQHAAYCTSTGAQIIIPDTSDFETYFSGTFNAGAPANAGYFKDDSYICGYASATNCGNGTATLTGYIDGNTEADCAGTAGSTAVENCILGHMANFVNAENAINFYSNDIGGEGAGTANKAVDPVTLFNLQTGPNDRGAISEGCISDAATTAATNRTANCVAMVNTCSIILYNYPERCIWYNFPGFSPDGTIATQELDQLALTWISKSPEGCLGSSTWYKVVSAEVDALRTSANADIYPFQEIWANPASQFLPSGQTCMRAFSYSGSGPGSGCTGDTSNSGGIIDAQITDTGLFGGNKCAAGNNSKQVGVYAIEFSNCYYQYTTGGARLSLGHCGVVWNLSQSTATIAAADLHFAYTLQLQINTGVSGVGNLKNAIGGTLGCTDCDGTIQTTATGAFPQTLPGGTARVYIQNSFGPI